MPDALSNNGAAREPHLFRRSIMAKSKLPAPSKTRKTSASVGQPMGGLRIVHDLGRRSQGAAPARRGAVLERGQELLDPRQHAFCRQTKTGARGRRWV
eukprot:3379138-Lingulodinium_polyedra.AAC.1